MLSVDEAKFRKWVGLTQQQYDIIKIVYRLRNRGFQPTPKNIQREYRTEYNKHLMKPNLFNLLRILQEKRVIKKTAQAEYSLDQEGIRQTLDAAGKGLVTDMDELERTRGQVDQFFKEITYRREQPDIAYLDGVGLYSALADSLERSDAFYVVADFPTIAYSREVIHTLEREPYAEKLWQCLKNKKPHINYLTDLNVDSLFNHAFRTYGDPKNAFRESAAALDRLLTQVDSHKNLEVRFTDAPHGLDVAVVAQKEPVEFIMFTRDDHDEIQGGIRVKSHRTASNMLRTFQQAWDSSTNVNTPQGRQLIQRLKAGLRNKYGILGE